MRVCKVLSVGRPGEEVRVLRGLRVRRLSVDVQIVQETEDLGVLRATVGERFIEREAVSVGRGVDVDEAAFGGVYFQFRGDVLVVEAWECECEVCETAETLKQMYAYRFRCRTTQTCRFRRRRRIG